MASLPGPYQIEFLLTGWTGPVREHVFASNVIALGSPLPGALPTTVDIQKMNGTSAKLNIVANQLWEFIRLHYSSSISCSGYTLWRYVPGTYAKDFISAGSVTNPLGSGAGGTNGWQLTQTYRTANGGIKKVVLLEGNQTGTTRTTLVANAVGNASQRLAAYVMSGDNIMLGGDDSYPVQPLRDSRGENELLFRLLYR